jgi:flagella synthesis protein FlgN
MDLPRTLQSLHHHLSLLNGLLQQEQAALLTPQRQSEEDGELLQRLAQEKLEQFHAIEDLEDYRGELQEALSDITNAEPSSRHAGTDLPLWYEVRELALQASRLNQLNGVLIHQRLIHNQRVLNNLREIRGPMLYDAGGNTANVATRVSSVA